jgi:hypothetical protein
MVLPTRRAWELTVTGADWYPDNPDLDWDLEELVAASARYGRAERTAEAKAEIQDQVNDGAPVAG